MKHCYSVALQKGGVGKTTTSIVLADGLVKRGFKVLAIDCEPQCNLSINYKFEDVTPNLYDVLTGECDVKSSIVTAENGVDVLPGSHQLYLYDTKDTQSLKRVVDAVASSYDYVIIDTPPQASKLSIVTLTACDRVIVPISSDMFGIKAFQQFYEGVYTTVKDNTNKQIAIAGLLLTRYKGVNVEKFARENLVSLCNLACTKIFESTIRESAKVKESQYLRESIFDLYPKEKITSDYDSFIDELIRE